MPFDKPRGREVTVWIVPSLSVTGAASRRPAVAICDERLYSGSLVEPVSAEARGLAVVIAGHVEGE